jgi:1-acyl-sn-glycerol-3-phosphate acyltransferase
MPVPTVNLGKLRSASRAAGFALWTFGSLGGAQLHQRIVPPDARYDVWQRWMKAWTHGLLVLCGVEETIASEGIPPRARGARLVVSNHRSPLDIALLLWHFGGHVLSRDDLAKWPVIGIAARKADTIFVDRQSAYSGLSAIRQIRQRLREGRTVIIFPEGGTSRGDEVRDFHAGAFGALKRLPVELLPVGIAYQPGCEFFDENFVQHFARVGVRGKTPVSICFGRGRLAQGSPTEIAVQMQQEVQALVNRARNAMKTE